LNPNLAEKLRRGVVVPAHPLALTADHKIDEPHQRALTRYYLAAGAGGLAVGVHSTQFAIHDPKVGLYRPVLELAQETKRQFTQSKKINEPLMIAGIVGPTKKALEEAHLARELGYHLGLLSLKALRGKSIDDLIAHTRSVADVIPIIGFYLQEVISGMTLPQKFWARFMEIPNVKAVKIAPFNRYQSLDVLEALAHSGRALEIALYTGNDDNIINDLVTQYVFNVNGSDIRLRIAGGLLGQWACWTSRAVEYLERIHQIMENSQPVPPDLLSLAAQLTLANRAVFDPENGFKGCIPGISYVLKHQHLLEGIRSLDPQEQLSPGQADRIDKVIHDYPHLTDDDFVQKNLTEWLK